MNKNMEQITIKEEISKNQIMSGVQLKFLLFLGSFVVSKQDFLVVLQSVILDVFQKTHFSLSTLYIYTPDLNKYKLH